MAASKRLVRLHLLSFAVTTLHPLLLPLFPDFAHAQGQDDELLIDCFRFDGQVSANNTKCPNSNACCGPRATCLSNRLCLNPGDPPSRLVRGPCAVRGWDDSCTQICTYNETGIFPRVTVCADSSLCCDDNPQCCQDGKGIFLDESGRRVSSRATAATTTYPPVSNGLERFTQTPSTSSASTTSTSASRSTWISSSTLPLQSAGEITAQPSSAPPPASDSDDSIGLKVGLGLGIPLSVLVTACVVYFILRRRGGAHAPNQVGGPFQLGPADGHSVYAAGGYCTPGCHPPEGYATAISPPAMAFVGSPKPPPASSQSYPVEMGDRTANELDTVPAGTQPRFELS